MRVQLATTIVALGCLCWPKPALSLTVSGTLGPQYGAPETIYR